MIRRRDRCVKRAFGRHHQICMTKFGSGCPICNRVFVIAENRPDYRAVRQRHGFRISRGMDPALASASTPAPVAFEDGLGTRRLAVDRSRNETVEMLCLRGELTARAVVRVRAARAR